MAVITLAQVWLVDPDGMFELVMRRGRDALNAGRITTDEHRDLREGAELTRLAARAHGRMLPYGGE